MSVERGAYGRATGVLIVSRGGRLALAVSPAAAGLVSAGARPLVSDAARFVVSAATRFVVSARTESGRGGVP
jgi:hypothetical protein